eukprot:gene2876-8155_t
MSIPDDPYTVEEMLHYGIINAVEYIEKKQREAKDEGREDDKVLRLSPAQLYSICREASKTVRDGDITPLIDVTIPDLAGHKYYHNRYVERAVVEQVDKLLEKAEVPSLPESDSLTTRDCFDFDVFFAKGRRPRMEDRHVIIQDFNGMMDQPQGTLPQAFFAVYDGHGGFEASKYVQAHLHHNIAKHPDFHSDVKKAIHESFLSTDEEFKTKATREALRSGSTAVLAFFRGKKLYVAWAGDSQCMVIKKDEQAEHLTAPHKPEDEKEKARIEEAGGFVMCRMGTWRVNGMLAVSRSFGDINIKPCVIPDPDIKELDLDSSYEFLILACDGLWDFMDKDKVVSFIKDWFSKKNETYGLCKSLVEHCIDSHASTDNVSIIVIRLQHLDSDIWTTPSA